jgi:hypothetical protein
MLSSSVAVECATSATIGPSLSFQSTFAISDYAGEFGKTLVRNVFQLQFISRTIAILLNNKMWCGWYLFFEFQRRVWHVYSIWIEQWRKFIVCIASIEALGQSARSYLSHFNRCKTCVRVEQLMPARPDPQIGISNREFSELCACVVLFFHWESNIW